MNKLRLVASTKVLDAESRVTTALTTTALYTTYFLAQEVAGENLGELQACYIPNLWRSIIAGL